MKNIYVFAAAAIMLLVTTGCSDDRYFAATEGKVIISTSFDNDVKVVSRASLEEELSESFILWISSEKGLVRKYEGLQNVPAEGIKLLGGNYVAEAWAGDSLSASFDSKYFKCRAPFTVTSGTTQVEMRCKIANVVTSVSYDDAVDQVLSDYTMTVGHTRGSLEFTGRDERKGYFMMPSGVDRLTWKLTGKQADGSIFTKTGEIVDPQGTTEYVLNVKYVGTSDQIGAGYITIDVDESTVDIEDEILITSAPEIKGIGFDIAAPVYGEEGNVGKKSVYISAASSLRNVVIESEQLGSFLSGNDVDLMIAQSNVISALEQAGIDFIYTYDTENDISSLKLNFNETFTSTIRGETAFVITVTDNNGKSSSATMTIIVTDAQVEAKDLSPDAVTTWATEAVIYGNVMKEGVAGAGFDYRKSGTSEWIHADGLPDVSGNAYQAKLSGLEPGTTYEFRATCDGFVSTVVKTFTTESAAQLQNAGFEDWDISSTPYLIYKPGSSMYWDSGNHGSAMMRKNLTTPESTIKHSGEFSAKLASQFVGLGGFAGKFAAGNLFIGQFLGTNGTDGILGWGRPFASRPKSLKGYVKYTPQTVAYESSDFNDLKKGDMDMGIIYIAILDSSTTPVDDSKNVSSDKQQDWPVIVKTKDRSLFSKTDPNVIAYGELVLTEATSGDGLIEFEIPLEYFRTDVKASNIMVTCSASRYGDYFVGGPSVMYLDDFELVY